MQEIEGIASDGGSEEKHLDAGPMTVGRRGKLRSAKVWLPEDRGQTYAVHFMKYKAFERI